MRLGAFFVPGEGKGKLSWGLGVFILWGNGNSFAFLLIEAKLIKE